MPSRPANRTWTHAWTSPVILTARCLDSSQQSSGAAAASDTPLATAAVAPASEAALLGSAWDPDGLFSNSSTALNFAAGEQMGDMIARRERERAARRAAAATPIPTPEPTSTTSTAVPTSTSTAASKPSSPLPLPPNVRPLRPLPADAVAATVLAGGGSLRPEELPVAVLSELQALLASDYMSVDLSWPGLQLLHLDPPVIIIEGFLTEEQCDQMVQQAESSGRMQASRIGSSNVSSLYGNASSARRTSTGMMVTPGVAGPVMDTVVSELQSRGKKLLRADAGPAWGPSGKMPRSRQYCYEALQVARYEAGQHFSAHEDGFPPHLAASNGFQRHATLLVYLNDVPRGGATRFDYLGLSVRPVKGTALLFFPAFSDGTSDVRSLHTAEDAVDTKYATQQWVARGLPKPASAKPLVPSAAGAGADSKAVVVGFKQPQDVAALRETELELRERVGRQAKGSKAAVKNAKGFGGKPHK